MIWLIDSLERESRSDLPSCCPLMIHITIGYCLEYLAYKHSRTLPPPLPAGKERGEGRATLRLHQIWSLFVVANSAFPYSLQKDKTLLLHFINVYVSLCQVIEMKKIQSNVQIGNILLRSRNYIKARPQVFCTEMGQVHPLLYHSCEPLMCGFVLAKGCENI